MEIVVGGDNSKFQVKEHTIRDARSRFDDPEESTKVPHFQAVVLDRRKNKDKPAICRLRYEDDAGNFLGLEHGMFFDVDDSDEMYLSMAIDVPESTGKVLVTVLERRPESFSERYDLLIGAVVIVALAFVLAFAGKGFFGWQ